MHVHKEQRAFFSNIGRGTRYGEVPLGHGGADLGDSQEGFSEVAGGGVEHFLAL